MKFLRFVLLIALSTSVVTIAADAVNLVPTWHSARIVALPSGGSAVAHGYLPALSCSSVGNCSAGGAFTDASNNTQGLLLNEVAGVWRAPIKLRVPSNAAADPGASVDAIACSTSGYCGAVGSYTDAKNNARSLVVSEVNGVWTSAREVNLPTGAIVTGQNSTLRSVSCPSAGNCSAVGMYLQQGSLLGNRTGFALSEVHGVWSNATRVAAPSKSNINSLMTLAQVSCSTAGNCGAVGSYVDTNNVTQGLVVTQVKGIWGSVTPLVWPSNANAYAGASLSEISCSSPRNCTALGSYTTSTGAIEGLATTEVRGAWRRAAEIAMPTSAAVNPHAFLYGYFSIDCPTSGNCSAGGQYLGGSGLYQGFFANEIGGRWRAAVTLSLPSGAIAAGKNGGVVAMSCQSPGNCSAGGTYLDGAGKYQALVVSEVGETWRTGEKLSLPAGAATVGVNGGVYSLICNRATSCTATGTFLGDSGTYQGFTATTS